MSQTNNTLDLRRLLRAIKQCRWVILPAVALALTLGIILSVKSLPKYGISGSMLIGEMGYDTESRAGGMAQIMKTFSVGGFSASTVDNEVIIAKSFEVMRSAVTRLNLTREYYGKDTEGKKSMLYHDTPLRVEAPKEYFDTLSIPYKVKVKILEDGKVNLKVQKGFLSRTIFEEEGVSLPRLISTPLGAINIMPVDSIYATTPYREITVNVTGTNLAATLLTKRADIDVQNKLADIIDVQYSCANVELGKAIVDGIMAEYNSKRLKRLHEASEATVAYYDSRIAETFPELQRREQALAEYQRNNSLMGIDSETALLVGTANESRQQIVEMSHHIMYYDMVLRTLRNRLNTDVIIPQMESLSDPNIGAFNAAIMERRELRRSATDDNEALQRLEERIELLRNLIIENSEKSLAKQRSDLAFIESKLGTAETRLDKYPTYQLEYFNLARDKEYTNSLYQYLVSQRENSVLQLYSNTNLGFVFQPAYVEDTPSVLRYLLWPIVMLVLAAFGAVGLGLLVMWCTPKVKGAMDLAFIHCDENAVDDSAGSAPERMRTRLFMHPDIKVLYSADPSGAGVASAELVGSLLTAGKQVEVIEGFSSNSELLTPEVQKRIADALEAGNDYVVMAVPSTEDLYQLEPVIDRKESALLLCLPYNKMKRSAVKRMLKGQTAGKVFTIIMK